MSDAQAATKKTQYGMGRKTLKSYLIGLGLSLLFTMIAFLITGKHLMADHYVYILLTILAVSQLFAQVKFFLCMTMSPEGRWNTMPFLFSILVLLVIVFGTLWIMVNLNYNMVH